MRHVASRWTITVVAAAVAALSACAPAKGPETAGTTAPRRFSDSYTPPARSEAECGEVRARAASFGEADTVGVQRALITRLIIAPVPWPPELTGKMITISYRVDHTGLVMADSIAIDGTGGHAYDARLRESVKRHLHRPAVFEQCAVSARVTQRLRLGGTVRQ
jgi:hypothetical protein